MLLRGPDGNQRLQNARIVIGQFAKIFDGLRRCPRLLDRQIFDPIRCARTAHFKYRIQGLFGDAGNPLARKGDYRQGILIVEFPHHIDDVHGERFKMSAHKTQPVGRRSAPKFTENIDRLPRSIQNITNCGLNMD